MHRIKELAQKELREIEESNTLNSHNIDSIVKLTKIIKNIDTIHAMEEAKYSNRGSYGISNDAYYEGSHDAGSYRGSYDGMSNAVDRRGRNADGSYRMRNDGGRDQRYSYDGYSRELKEDLEHLKHKTHGREKEMLEGFIKEL